MFYLVGDTVPMLIKRTSEPMVDLMTAEELAQSMGEHLRLARIAKAWTAEQAAEAAGVSIDGLEAVEHGRGGLQDFVAIAASFGFAHELWNATRPRANNLNELERIEHAKAERAAGGSAAGCVYDEG